MNDGRYEIMRDSLDRPASKISRLHLVLFLATILTTLMAGALLEGNDIFKNPQLILSGWSFSLTLMTILGCHELGHYYFALRHKVDVSLPYFLPVPPPITFIGTFGAFIRMRGPIPNRKALLEIGAAGPIAGFIVAVPALLIGLSLSTVVKLEGGEFILGDSLLMNAAVALMFPNLGANEDIMLHSVAFAGWIGLLVTMLNLLPMGQLDGGHISYALLGRKQALVGKIVIVALVPMGIFLSPNWILWAVLILLLMRTVVHPPVRGINIPLSRREIVIGLVCLAIFILCFMPVPFSSS